MYIEIKENKLISWCENQYSDYEYVDVDYSTFNPSKYQVIDGVLTDISGTQEYQDKTSQQENVARISDLKSQIEALDIKRIRAIAEPQLKDADSGQTWLEFYTEQIQELRLQLQ